MVQFDQTIRAVTSQMNDLSSPGVMLIYDHESIPRHVHDGLAENMQHDLCRAFTDTVRFAVFFETDKAHLVIGITPLQTVTRRAVTIGRH